MLDTSIIAAKNFKMPVIFLCYRRQDSFPYAGRLYDRLASHFGKDAVFMDVDNIEPGLDYVDVLQHTIEATDVLIVVIGRFMAHCC